MVETVYCFIQSPPNGAMKTIGKEIGFVQYHKAV
jgi:hypothetical protein